MKQIIFLLAGLVVGLCTCKNIEPSDTYNDESAPSFADTIIYDVIVKNPNPDDRWANECLKHLELPGLLDELFESVYTKHAVAYDYFTGKRIRPASLKKMEKNRAFSRDQIGKIQFTEAWRFNKTDMKFQKTVLSVVLGEELYDLDGGVRGYKPVFKVNLNPEL